MNPVFVVLVIIGAIVLWFCSNSIFPVIGKYIYELIEETKYNMSKDEEEKD